jgi:hypothetical protein
LPAPALIFSSALAKFLHQIYIKRLFLYSKNTGVHAIIIVIKKLAALETEALTMISLTPVQKQLLTAFYYESKKEKPDYIKNISADQLCLSQAKFNEAFHFLYEKSLIWVYDKAVLENDEGNPHDSNGIIRGSFISAYGKKIAKQLLNE